MVSLEKQTKADQRHSLQLCPEWWLEFFHILPNLFTSSVPAGVPAETLQKLLLFYFFSNVSFQILKIFLDIFFFIFSAAPSIHLWALVHFVQLQDTVLCTPVLGCMKNSDCIKKHRYSPTSVGVTSSEAPSVKSACVMHPH